MEHLLSLIHIYIISEKSTEKKSKYRWLTPEVISTYYAQSLCFITEGWIAPVSYTHLDVYKRQEQVSETEEAKELFAPKESDATAAIGDELESSYAVVIDEQDGTVVAGKNAHEKMYPASMTKVMTVLVAAEQAEKNAVAAAKNENTEIDRQAVIENKLNEIVTITREATDLSLIHIFSTAVRKKDNLTIFI